MYKQKSKVNFNVYSLLFSVGIGIATIFSCHKTEEHLTQLYVKEGSFTADLSIPNTMNGKNGTLNASRTSIDLIAGNTNVLGYQNGILGPTIRIKKGETAEIAFKNQLSESTNIHWHGLVIPANMDGHPESAINAGSSFQYNFDIQQRAGTYWYHPHVHSKTADQVTKGLAGFFIVNDYEESALNLPANLQEIPLVIQDKRLTNGKDIVYSPTQADIMSGYFGDHIFVNGVYAPVQKVSTQWYRLRVLNGSTARVYNLALSNAASFYIIGNDGGLLTKPETVQTLLLAPGERADILVDLTKGKVGDEIYLQNNVFDGGIQGKQSYKILKLQVDKIASDNFVLPVNLSNITSIATSTSKRTRTFDIANAGHGSGHGGGHGGSHSINSLTYDATRIDEKVKSGETEIWIFDNSKGEDLHPMHIHAVQFQVIKREGGRGIVAPSEKGWKDTVLCLPGEKVSVIMTFPIHKGKYLYHCHNLEHEDDGMMLNYLIE